MPYYVCYSMKPLLVDFIACLDFNSHSTYLQSSGTQDSTQQTMLTTWLVELFLNDLGALKDEGDRDGHAKMTQEFHTFLETKSLRVRHMTLTSICDNCLICVLVFYWQECLDANSKTVYDLLSSHGAVEDVVFFAMLMKGEVDTHPRSHIQYCKSCFSLKGCIYCVC